MKKHITQLILVSIMTFTQSCADYGLGGSSDSNSVLPDTATSDPTNNPTTKPYPPSESTEGKVLLFNGQGISTSDWQSFQNILEDMKLEQISVDDLKKFSLIIVPGGKASTISSGLTAAARLVRWTCNTRMDRRSRF